MSSLKGMHLEVSVNPSVISSLVWKALDRGDLIFKVSEGQFSYGISSLNINSLEVQPLIGFVYTVTRRHLKFVFPGNQTLDELCLNGIRLRKEN